MTLGNMRAARHLQRLSVRDRPRWWVSTTARRSRSERCGSRPRGERRLRRSMPTGGYGSAPPGTMGPITGRVEQGPGHGYCPHLKEFWALRLRQKKNLEKKFGRLIEKLSLPSPHRRGLEGNSCASHVRLPGYAHCRPKLARFLRRGRTPRDWAMHRAARGPQPPAQLARVNSNLVF
jgi:hypothetical protein